MNCTVEASLPYVLERTVVRETFSFSIPEFPIGTPLATPLLCATYTQTYREKVEGGREKERGQRIPVPGLSSYQIAVSEFASSSLTPKHVCLLYLALASLPLFMPFCVFLFHKQHLVPFQMCKEASHTFLGTSSKSSSASKPDLSLYCPRQLSMQRPIPQACHLMPNPSLCISSALTPCRLPSSTMVVGTQEKASC